MPEEMYLTLSCCNVGIWGKVHMATTHLLSLNAALAPQIDQNSMAAAVELFPEHLRAHPCRTANNQRDEGIGQAACTGKTDMVVKPKPISSKLRDRAKGVPDAIVSETAVVSFLGQKAADGGDRVLHLGSQRLDHPTRVFGKPGYKALARWGGGCHGGPPMKYCIADCSLYLFAILYQNKYPHATLFFQPEDREDLSLYVSKSTSYEP